MKIYVDELYVEFNKLESILDEIDRHKDEKAKGYVLVDYELTWMDRLEDGDIIIKKDTSNKIDNRKYRILISKMSYWEDDLPKYTYKVYKALKEFLRFHGVI